MQMIAFLTNAFPLWVLLASLLALWYPPLFTWFTGPLITGGLAVIMLGMGLTLGLEDARRVAHRRLSVGAGLGFSRSSIDGHDCVGACHTAGSGGSCGRGIAADGRDRPTAMASASAISVQLA